MCRTFIQTRALQDGLETELHKPFRVFLETLNSYSSHVLSCLTIFIMEYTQLLVQKS